MDPSTQVELVRRLLRLETDGAGGMAPAPVRHPVSDYTSSEQLRLELSRLFRAGPLLAGLACEAAGPGDWFSLDAAGSPVLVVRDAEGRLRAFLNVCRHRGARVAEGRGRAARGFTCPYHAWRYALAGSLTAPSHREGFAGLDRRALALAPLPVAERAGLVYVRPSPGAPIDLEGVLSGIERELAPFDLAGYHLQDRRSFSRAVNWKLVVDTFLESYHVPFLHRESIARYFRGDFSLFDPFGRNGRLAALRRSVAELEGRPEAEWSIVPHTTLLYCLFPNAVLIYQQDHVQLWQVFPEPGSPDAATVVVSQYVPEPPSDEKAARHWRVNMDLLLDVTNREDFEQCERMQQGFHTSAQECVIFGRNEPGLIHFHRQVREAIGLQTEGGGSGA
jgi:phenylpropionate dioxygenase-like ring-hydroxylating dioxygenase large terminal subunit